jgi:hypothetical protein
MSSPTKYLPLIKGLAIGSTFISAGGFSIVTLMTIPAFKSVVLQSHLVAAKQFATIYSIGLVSQPPSTILISCMHAYVARQSYRAGSPTWRLWAISTALIAAVLPWTFGLMEPTSHGLLRIAEVEPKTTAESEMDAKDEAVRTEQLLRRWDRLNTVRAILATGAGALGVVAVLT